MRNAVWRMAGFRIASVLAFATTALTSGGISHAQSSPSAFTSGTRYDAMHRVVGTIAQDPDGTGPLRYSAVRNTYDGAGRLTKVEKGELANWKGESIAPSAWGADFVVQQVLDTVYDSQGRKVKETVSGGGQVKTVTQFSYDLAGRLQCTAVRMDPAQWGSQTDACVPQLTGPDGADRVTRNIYDAADQLLQVREGVGTGVEAAEVTYRYTANGKREYVIDANGNRAQLSYDGHDRQEKWIFPSTTRPPAFDDTTPVTAFDTSGAVNAADFEQYEYDASGNRTRLKKRDNRWLKYSYDALSRVTSKCATSTASCVTSAASTGRDVFYDYDLEGRMTKARFDSIGGEGITNDYNDFGELTSSTISIGGLSRTLSYAYDLESKRTSLTHAAFDATPAQTFTYARDDLGRVSNIYEGTTQTSTYQLIQAAFNNRGLIASVQRATSGTAFLASFGYDPIGRLGSIANDAVGTADDLTIDGTVNDSIGYNPASQIINQRRSNDSYSWTGSVAVSRPYTTNGLNQYISAGPASFTYDANGNLTSDGSTTFVYDIENRLVSASGTKTATLIYDPMGRLFQVTGPTSNTRFLYDGDELVAEYDSAGTIARRYVHSDNVDDPVVQYDGASVGVGNRVFLMPDEHGSIAGLFYSNGTVAKNSYDEYGIPATTTPGASITGRFAYTGQAWIPELGMYHYKARLYSPTLGRFLQTDPIGYDDQVNLYAYVANDPVNKADPLGKMGCPNNQCSGEKLERGSQVANGVANGQTAKTVGLAVAGKAGGAKESTIASLAKSAKPLGVAAGAVSETLKTGSQIQNGKPVDSAIANTGGRVATSGAAGAMGTVIGVGIAELASGGTVTIPLAIGGLATIAADQFGLTDKAGNTVENAYNSAKTNIINFRSNTDRFVRDGLRSFSNHFSGIRDEEFSGR